MENEELKQLANTLLKGGLAINENEAMRIAKEMYETSNKVIAQQNVKKEQKEENEMYIPPMPEIKQENKVDVDKYIEQNIKKEEPEPIQEIKKEEPKIESKSNWSEKATNTITSNNEILKTIEEIGKKEYKDPNDNFGKNIGPENYSKIENFYAAPKKDENWLPSKPREQAPMNQETKPEEPKQFNRSNFVETEKPKQISPEEYSAMRVQNEMSLSQQYDEEEKRLKAEEEQLKAEIKQEEEQLKAEENKSEEKYSDEEIKQEGNNNLNDDLHIELNTSEVNNQEKEEENDFLKVKQEETKPEENINTNQENQAKPEETKPEEKKKSSWTEDELKLKEQVDLSKVFNFSNRG
ncbi:MAG: hypothetical protein AB7V77_03375 [Candidatus Woesearchaeota archaeon]